MAVQDILNAKGAYAPTTTSDAPIIEAIDILKFEKVGALVVSTNGETVEGIISERDIVRGLRRFGREIFDLEVADLMTADVVTCTPGSRISQVVVLMAKHGIRHVPVLRDGKLAGMISIRDILNLRRSELETPLIQTLSSINAVDVSGSTPVHKS